MNIHPDSLQQNICKTKKCHYKNELRDMSTRYQGRYLTIIAYTAKWMRLYYSKPDTP